MTINPATAAVVGVAGVHLAFAAGELFLPRWMIRRLGLPFSSSADAEVAARIVRNAGIYNAFVAAGLAWAAALRGGWLPDPASRSSSAFELATFFLGCVVAAGLVGTVTLRSRVTFVLQTLLGAAALAAVWTRWR